MVEWICWEPRTVIGKNKTKYWQQIVDWCAEPGISGLPPQEQKRLIAKRLKAEGEEKEQAERYAKGARGNLNPREALRQARFFSENYLNKEFDIFWSLVSDRYLDEFYGRFFAVTGGGKWSSQGHSGLFRHSTGIGEMQMDNISYNGHERLLVGNELKLAAKKNPDQVLKYVHMFLMLRDRGFIAADCRFALLFISAQAESADWDTEIERELKYCRDTKKVSYLCDERTLAAARESSISSVTWKELMDFNTGYLSCLGEASQVEVKLLEGFNISLGHKRFMQADSLALSHS